MKLCYVLLLSLVAMVAADSYEHYQNSYPQEVSQEESSPSNYYRPVQKRRQRSGLAGLVKGLFGADDNRRQFTGTGTGFGTGGGVFGNVLPAATGGFNAGTFASIAFPMLLFGLGAAGLAAAFMFLNMNSSGRGLDTDEWEVDHSVWMNQLQKDFEDSWSTE